jgi:Tfp pilus assembly protein PilO
VRLSRRQAHLGALAGLILFSALYYWIVISPALSRQRSLSNHIRKKEADLVAVTALKRDWESFQEVRAKAQKTLERKGKGFSLLSFMEDTFKATGMETKIQYMKPMSLPGNDEAPKPQALEIGLDGVNTRELITFLQRVESSGKAVHFKRTKIQRSSRSKESSLKVTLQIYTYTPS